jgi:hypothetical protein
MPPNNDATQALIDTSGAQPNLLLATGVGKPPNALDNNSSIKTRASEDALLGTASGESLLFLRPGGRVHFDHSFTVNWAGQVGGVLDVSKHVPASFNDAREWRVIMSQTIPKTYTTYWTTGQGQLELHAWDTTTGDQTTHRGDVGPTETTTIMLLCLQA